MRNRLEAGGDTEYLASRGSRLPNQRTRGVACHFEQAPARFCCVHHPEIHGIVLRAFSARALVGRFPRTAADAHVRLLIRRPAGWAQARAPTLWRRQTQST